jgi:flavin reductase (DIM6/NTAB) family NADH-FMN oxidoreductase RutF
MAKVARSVERHSNDFCPQTLFLYGTYGEDCSADFGLFCWFSYMFDSELGIMACIGGEKLTKERIHNNKIFSACLVTEKILPLADRFGCVDGHSPEKMKIDAAIEKGQVLDVPILTDSPLAYELEVKSFLPLEGSEIMLCKIRNVLVDEELMDEDMSVEDRIRAIAPVTSTKLTYFGWDGRGMGAWGEPMTKLNTKV